MTEMPRQMPQRHFTPCSSLLLLSLGVTLLLPPDMAIAKDKSWLQWLREQFGYNPPLAPGGSRAASMGSSFLDMALILKFQSLVGINSAVSESKALRPAGSPPATNEQMVCLITPRLQDSKTPTAVVALPNPTLLSQAPLAEWALYDGQGYKLKGALARSDKPLEGAFSWPLAPLQPGQTVTLRLRPMQASGSEYVEIALKAASAADQAEASRLLRDRRDRLEVVQELLRQGKQSLALELVFAPLEAPSPDLLELRRILVATGCAAKS